jgi:hypothetical protein
MASAGAYIKAGIRDARWTVYFTLMFLPTGILAVVLAALIERPGTGNPGVWTWSLVWLAALWSFLWAAWKEAPYGYLGSAFATAVYALVAPVFVYRAHQAAWADGTEIRIRIILGRRRSELTARITAIEDEIETEVEEGDAATPRSSHQSRRNIRYREVILTP